MTLVTCIKQSNNSNFLGPLLCPSENLVIAFVLISSHSVAGSIMLQYHSRSWLLKKGKIKALFRKNILSKFQRSQEKLRKQSYYFVQVTIWRIQHSDQNRGQRNCLRPGKDKRSALQPLCWLSWTRSTDGPSILHNLNINYIEVRKTSQQLKKINRKDWICSKFKSLR